MRLTKWEGLDADGPRAVLVKRDGPFAPILQEALRKLARYEDVEEAHLPIVGKPMTDKEMDDWIQDIRRKHEAEL